MGGIVWKKVEVFFPEGRTSNQHKSQPDALPHVVILTLDTWNFHRRRSNNFVFSHIMQVYEGGRRRYIALAASPNMKVVSLFRSSRKGQSLNQYAPLAMNATELRQSVSNHACGLCGAHRVGPQLWTGKDWRHSSLNDSFSFYFCFRQPRRSRTLHPKGHISSYAISNPF